MTFDDVATEPEQEFELYVDTHGVHEYSTKYVHSIVLSANSMEQI